MNKEGFREWSEARIAENLKDLEMIESVRQKVLQQGVKDPADKKMLGQLRGLKWTLSHNTKVHEKFLKFLE